jgi:hypothetical protein
MHSRLIDLSRASTCATYAETRDDGRKVSALVWIVPSAAAWLAFLAWVIS